MIQMNKDISIELRVRNLRSKDNDMNENKYNYILTQDIEGRKIKAL